MTLRNGDGGVWSGQNNVTPASIVLLTVDELREFGGHEYDIAACASDVLPTESTIIAPDCEGGVYETAYAAERGQLRQEQRLGGVLGYERSGNWREVLFGRSVDGEVVAVMFVRNPPGRYGEVVLGTVGRQGGDEVRFEAVGVRVLDMAVGQGTVALLMESEQGDVQLVAPSLD